KGDGGFGLRLPEVQVGGILRNNGTGRERVAGVDQQVVVTRGGLQRGCGIQGDTVHSELNLERGADGGAVLEVLEINLCAGGDGGKGGRRGVGHLHGLHGSILGGGGVFQVGGLVA